MTNNFYCSTVWKLNRRRFRLTAGLKGLSGNLNYRVSISCISVLFLFFVASCAVSSERVVAPSPQVSKVKRVAVLPFSNISGRTYASEMVADIFVTEMFKLGKFHIEEPGNVREFMIKEGMLTIGEIDIENLKMMSEQLGLEAVIVGTVEEFDEGLTLSPKVPVVSITARMVEPGSGKIIWSAKNKRSGEDYVAVFGIGRVRSITSLTQLVISEMIRSIK